MWGSGRKFSAHTQRKEGKINIVLWCFLVSALSQLNYFLKKDDVQRVSDNGWKKTKEVMKQIIGVHSFWVC